VPVYDRTALRLNELLPRPGEIDWDGDGVATANDEWIEIVNRSVATVDLAGWALDDVAEGGSRPYIFPAGAAVGPGAFLVVFRSTSGLALNNDADTARLLAPDGIEIDSYAYESPRADRSYSRSGEGDGPWTDAYPPSPGRPNAPATPTPTVTPTATVTPFPAGVMLNELLPDPRFVDWDGNGKADFTDEFIELYNAAAAPAQLGGWALADDTRTYTIPVGTVIWPQSYLLLFRTGTDLALGDRHDRVSLLRPDGSLADTVAYDQHPGIDRSLCRAADGAGAWTKECYVTPGQPNRLLPPPPPPSGAGPAPGESSGPAASPSTIAAARAAADDTRATITGIVTLPPGLIARTIYVQDAVAGIKVYLRTGEYPALKVGDRVRVTGWTRSFHGETELSAPDPGYLAWLDAPGPDSPLPIATGKMGETHEGRLVWLMGRVTRFEPQAIVLDDGTGPARVYFPESLPWRRPYVQIGELWAAVGVVGQYAWEAPWAGGHRLIPRFESDVSLPPAFLPVTGGY
jgi:hypothetical protein